MYRLTHRGRPYQTHLTNLLMHLEILSFLEQEWLFASEVHLADESVLPIYGKCILKYHQHADHINFVTLIKGSKLFNNIIFIADR